MRTLRQKDLELISSETLQWLEKATDEEIFEEGHALSNDILIYLATNVVLPVVVGLCSQKLYEVLQGKDKKMLSKKDVEKIINNLIGEELKLPEELDPELLNELKTELNQVDVREEEITIFYMSIRKKLKDAQLD